MTDKKLTLAQITDLAQEYKKQPDTRILSIKKVWSQGGHYALTAMEKALGLRKGVLLAWAHDYFKQKRQWRWKHKPLSIGQPPVPVNPDAANKSGEKDHAAALAEMVAGFNGGEQRYCRRNTFAGTISNRARKIKA